MPLVLLVTLLAPLAGLVAVLCLPATATRAPRGLAVAAMLVAAVGAATLWWAFDARSGELQFVLTLPWLNGVGLDWPLRFGVDGLSLPLLAVSALIGLVAMLVGGDTRPQPRAFYALLLGLAGAALAAFASVNLLVFFLFAEMATLPKYLLITVWGELPPGDHGRDRDHAATQQLLYVQAGAMLAMFGVVGIVCLGGYSCDLVALRDVTFDPVAQRWLFGLLLLGFGVWTTLWPLHAWAPLAYAAAPTPAAMLFAGVVKNLGAYGIVRAGVLLLPEGLRWWAAPLAVMAAANILVAGWTALRQRDWQLLLGYGSVSHAGYFFLGLASLNYTGLGGAVFFLSAHGLAIAACFALVGVVTGAAGRRDLASLGGLARRLPFVGTALAMAVIAAIGVPGFANFWGELLTILGAFRHDTLLSRLAAAAGAWGLVLTATYLLRALHATLFGPAKPGDDHLNDLTTPGQRLPYVLLLAALLLLGVWPRLALDPIHASLAPLLQLLNPPG